MDLFFHTIWFFLVLFLFYKKWLRHNKKNNSTQMQSAEKRNEKWAFTGS